MRFQDLIRHGVDLFQQNIVSPQIGDLSQDERSISGLEKLAVDHSVMHHELATADQINIHDLDIGRLSADVVFGCERSS